MSSHSGAPPSDLKLEVESFPSGTVVRCSGRITASTTRALSDQVHPLVSGTKSVTIDMAKITYLDSSGLGAVVQLWTTAQRCGCAFKLTNVSPRIKDLLGLANLASMLEG